MKPADLYDRFEELKQYVGLGEADIEHLCRIRPFVESGLPFLVEDFYAEIQRHPHASKVITGGQEQVERLKHTLIDWLVDLFCGCYDQQYASRRWQAGRRHVEIGLDRFYTNVAFARLRAGLAEILRNRWQQPPQDLATCLMSLNKLLDLDLAIIEDAYQTEYLKLQQQRERWATIGEVAGTVANELRNPLNVIKTSVYYLLNAQEVSADKVFEHLERIARQAGAAGEVITELTNFAELPLPAPHPVVLKPCVQQALESSKIPSSVHVSWNGTSEVPSVLGDEHQLGIVFKHLIRNARDAMQEGGSLTITLDPRGDELVIAISDTGVGIHPENLGRITEPLYTTKPGGIGLGLAIARAILHNHGSQLRVTSELGQGSTFAMRLPVVA